MNRFLGARFVAAAILVALLIGLLLPTNFVFWLTAENGPVELASACLWMMAAGMIVVVCLDKNWELAPFALLALLCGARELDEQKNLTSGNIAKLNYWLDSAFPLLEKLTVLAIAIPIAAFLIFSLIRNWQSLRARFAAGDGALYTVLTLVALMAFVMIMDGVPRTINEITGHRVGPGIHAAMLSVEEICEMLLPVLGVFALGQFVASKEAQAVPAMAPRPSRSSAAKTRKSASR